MQHPAVKTSEILHKHVNVIWYLDVVSVQVPEIFKELNLEA